MYLDPAQERLDEERDVRFRDTVEATRLGTVYASNAKAYGKWRRAHAVAERPRSDVEMEAAIMRIASQFPGSVERVTT